MQLIGSDEDGNILILYDSRWRDPTLLGYSPSDPMYHTLRELYRRITSSNKEELNHDRCTTDQEGN